MSPKQRILIVMNYYYKKGVNRESVNKVYFKIIKNNSKLHTPIAYNKAID